MLIQLLHETPVDRIVFTTSVRWTAGAMITEVEQGTETGLLYITEFFRTVRDFMNKNVSDT